MINMDNPDKSLINSPALEVHNLTVSYNRRPVLWDIDFNLPQGAIIGVIGPNGAGKSTLIKAIMGLIPSNSGFVKIFDQPLEQVRRRISYVPQRESVDWDFPASVYDVVLMGRYKKNKLLRPISRKDRKITWEALEKVQLKEFAHRQISQLSGGQQQRVFIARSIAQQADLYLMDEPFAGVDAASETAILELLQRMKKEGKTMVIVHHDLHTVRQFFDWIILLNTRQVAAGPTQEAFTAKKLAEAYGGQLTIFSQVADAIEAQDYPIREKQFEDRS
jgi:manganese/zinc/iron transport system ATP- binding protein